MGKHRSLDERLAYAERQVERNRRSLDKHDKRYQKLVRAGGGEKAAEADVLRRRADKLHRKWTRLASRLRKQIVTRDVLQRRAPKVESGRRGPVPPAEARRLEREQRAEQMRQAQRRKRMAAAGVDWDPRTAAGKRSYDLVALGPSLRAYVSHFNACLKRKPDRTDTRLLAWAEFDQHYHKVSAGLIASPQFEPGVDTSTIPGVADSRLDALREDHALRQKLGEDLHALLVEVIYHGRRLSDLPGLEGYDHRDRTVLLLRALDLAALHWGLDQARVVRHKPMRVVAHV